jgi:hypothetical protein
MDSIHACALDHPDAVEQASATVMAAAELRERGYVFLFPFRQGVELSFDQGTSAVDLMNSEFARNGLDALNA